jgi:hypothetical protein
MNPFDVINAINFTKENVFAEEPSFKEYSPFMVNRGLSYFPDTVLYANEMNRYSNIPNDWQFFFFLNTIPRKKRFSKWSKKDKETKSLQLVKEYFGYSNEKAKEALNVLSDDHLKMIEEKLQKGGR